MAGGLMQLVSTGLAQVILNGNPQKSYFKSMYRQYTNFGMQKFIVNYEGAKTLRLNEPSTFTFKIPRYADLLMDCYMAFALPNIWSPILPPQQLYNVDVGNTNINTYKWAPYEFKWIEYLGAKMISKISITCGNSTLQEYSGDYFLAAVQRDFDTNKKELFYKMIGHVPELYDPANAGSRVNSYPNAFYDDSAAAIAVGGCEPSIPGRIIYVPLNSWFGLNSEQAYPLVCSQYMQLEITVTLRPLKELFMVRDVLDAVNNYPYVAPNFNEWHMQFYRFLQPPPDIQLSLLSFADKRTDWNTDIHLNCTYCFLSEEEQNTFALTEKQYLIKQVHERIYYNVTGPNKIQLESLGLVPSWLFYFQRSDANLRNDWSNYTNWAYGYQPLNVVQAPTSGTYTVYRVDEYGDQVPVQIGPGVNPDGKLTGLLITQPYSPQNIHNILVFLGILMDGNYRENVQAAGVYNYIEKYVRTSGNAPDGLYCYNFGLNSDNKSMQPSGAMNMSIYNQVELEFTTIIPTLDPLAQSLTICDPISGQVIGINKPTWRIYDYNFDLHFFEERYNIVRFMSGEVGLMFAN